MICVLNVFDYSASDYFLADLGHVVMRPSTGGQEKEEKREVKSSEWKKRQERKGQGETYSNLWILVLKYWNIR